MFYEKNIQYIPRRHCGTSLPCLEASPCCDPPEHHPPPRVRQRRCLAAGGRHGQRRQHALGRWQSGRATPPCRPLKAAGRHWRRRQQPEACWLHLHAVACYSGSSLPHQIKEITAAIADRFELTQTWIKKLYNLFPRVTLWPRSLVLKFSLFSLFFQSEQYFSLTTIQSEQCFSASFS